MNEQSSYDERLAKQAAECRRGNSAFSRRAEGYGVIRHSDETQMRVRQLVHSLEGRDASGDAVCVYDLLMALDRVPGVGLWLVVHQIYARNVYLDGRSLDTEDFKVRPEGHTGGALNIVPAYAGYLGANVLSGQTRGWLMGQGHCVAAVDSLNLFVGNTTAAHAARYDVTDDRLTRYVKDFYSYRLGDNGRQDSPLGSHVNVHTAGGLAEGGYLGSAELQCVHMPLPGERLVAFLSDGAFEEQRGSDWAPRSLAEQRHQASPEVIARLFPTTVPRRLFMTHTRPEPLLGLLGPLHTGAGTVGLGYTNHGGTLSTPGMLFVNRCSWAHCVRESARLLHLSDSDILSVEEREALDGRRSPHGVIIPETVE